MYDQELKGIISKDLCSWQG